MVNANRCLFRCIGCKTKATEESEFININESPRHTKVIHINDLIVSKPQLVADTPKSLYFTRPSAERQSSSLGSVKEPIAIPIRYGWPSDLSFEQVSTLRKKDDEIHDKEGEKIIVPLSNVSGLLEDNKLGKDMTLSRSIALAENIYQSERRQLERSLHEDALYSGELLQNKPIFEKIMSRDKHSFSLDKSTKSAVTRSEEDEKSTISQLDHICNAGIECDDADSLTSRMWSIFVNASRAFNGYGHQISFHERSGIAYKHSDDWINYQGKEENYVVTPREALEIVEGAIQRLNQNNW